MIKCWTNSWLINIAKGCFSTKRWYMFCYTKKKFTLGNQIWPFNWTYLKVQLRSTRTKPYKGDQSWQIRSTLTMLIKFGNSTLHDYCKYRFEGSNTRFYLYKRTYLIKWHQSTNITHAMWVSTNICCFKKVLTCWIHE